MAFEPHHSDEHPLPDRGSTPSDPAEPGIPTTVPVVEDSMANPAYPPAVPLQPGPPALGRPSRALSVAAVVVLCVTFLAGVTVDRAVLLPADGQQAGTAGSAPGSTVPPNAPSDFGLFWQALSIVQQHYVDQSALNSTTLTYGAINGLIAALGDPGHTSFLTPAEIKSQQQELDGSFSGVGARMDEVGGVPIIVSVVRGAPADKAGIRAGDRLIEIDGVSAQGLSIDEVVSRIRGPKGTKVTLTVIHADAASPVSITIVRDVVNFPAVSWAMVPGTKVADIRIEEFSQGVAVDFRAATKAAKAAGATSFVLDLRGNPGGLVDEAVGVVSELVERGNVYIREDRNSNKTPVPVAGNAATASGRLVVLVDFGSASAAEIVAGALQDDGRGTIVGTRTFGTGTVLNTFPLSDGSAINLGVELWLTPDGHRIFPEGITPTDKVDLPLSGRALAPDDLTSMTESSVLASTDTQLTKALSLLGVS